MDWPEIELIKLKFCGRENGIQTHAFKQKWLLSSHLQQEVNDVQHYQLTLTRVLFY